MTVDEDWEDDDSILTIRCSSCGEDVYEDAVVCPSCNEYVDLRSGAFAGKPKWIVWLGAAGIIAVLWMLLT